MANVATNPRDVGNPRDDLEAIKADMRELREDLRKLANSVGDRAVGEAREFRGSVQEKVEEQLQGVERYVETRPLTSILAAFGVGLLVGKLASLK